MFISVDCIQLTSYFFLNFAISHSALHHACLYSGTKGLREPFDLRQCGSG